MKNNVSYEVFAKWFRQNKQTAAHKAHKKWNEEQEEPLIRKIVREYVRRIKEEDTKSGKVNKKFPLVFEKIVNTQPQEEKQEVVTPKVEKIKVKENFGGCEVFTPEFSKAIKDKRSEILYFLRKERDMNQLKDRFWFFHDVDSEDVREGLNLLGVKLLDIQNRVIFLPDIEEDEGDVHRLPNAPDGILRIGVTSDKHYVCKKCKEQAIERAYEWFAEEGCDFSTDSGDIVTGWGVYPHQRYEVKCIGADEQIDYACQKHPLMKAITPYGKLLSEHFNAEGYYVTILTTGNHDEDLYKQGGVKAGNHITKQRPDIHCIGGARETIKINNLKIRMVHARGKAAKGWYYKIQNYVDALPHSEIDCKENPDIILFGHWHQFFWYFYSGIHCIGCGSFQGETKLSKELGLMNVIGAIILEIPIEDGYACKDKINIKFRRF